MSKIKHSKLISLMGENMSESVGLPQVQDRFAGFVPSSRSFGEMALDQIVEDPDQPRRTFDPQALEELAASIKSHGVQQPIQLRWEPELNKWVIVYGHRRYRAAKMSGLSTIPCTFTDEMIDEPSLRVRQLIENCQRENLAPLEMARGLQSLSQLTGWSQRQMAEELGISHVTVHRFLGLLQLPEDVQELVQQKKLAASVAGELHRIDDPAQQSDVAKRITERKLSRNEACAEINQLRNHPKTQTAQKQPEMELLTRTPNVCVYRSPLASDLKVKRELLGILEQMDLEKVES